MTRQVRSNIVIARSNQRARSDVKSKITWLDHAPSSSHDCQQRTGDARSQSRSRSRSLTDQTVDVALSVTVNGSLEEIRRRAVFHESTVKEEHGVIRNSPSLT